MPNITINNKTVDNPMIGVFRRLIETPTLKAVAWKVLLPPSQGSVVIPILDGYEAYVNYGDQSDPNGGIRTASIEFTGTAARFVVQSEGQAKKTALVLKKSSKDPTPNQVSIANEAGEGVWGHITQLGSDIYPPQVIWPDGVLMEDIRAPYLLAIVGDRVKEGDRLIEEEVSRTQTPILPGQTAIVTGSRWDGYSIAVE